MKAIDITELVRNNKVYFSYLRQGSAFYKVSYKMKDYTFPVPLDDIGTATLLNEDKAIFYMRWIRKAVDDKTFVGA
jgi:hypothetical protein